MKTEEWWRQQELISLITRLGEVVLGSAIVLSPLGDGRWHHYISIVIIIPSLVTLKAVNDSIKQFNSATQSVY